MNIESEESNSQESGGEELEEISEMEKLIGGGAEISEFFHLKEKNLKWFKDIGKLRSGKAGLRVPDDRENVHNERGHSDPD